MSQRTFVITGGTSGLGLALVEYLGRQPQVGRLVVGARDDAGRARVGAVVPPWRLTVLPLDLASLGSVRAFAEQVRITLAGEPLDGLGCVAGLQLAAGEARSDDGHELTFAVNHLAHHALVQHLRPLLTPGAAVVLVGSGTHDPADRSGRFFGFRGGRYTSAAALANGDADPAATARQVARDRYATSKLCNVVSAYEWARRVPPSEARFFVVDPGLMPGTGLARRHPAPLRWAWSRVMPSVARLLPGASTPERSARVLGSLLLSGASDRRTGLHVDHLGKVVRSSDDSYRPEVGADLFAVSDALVAAADRRHGVA